MQWKSHPIIIAPLAGVAKCMDLCVIDIVSWASPLIAGWGFWYDKISTCPMESEWACIMAVIKCVIIVIYTCRLCSKGYRIGDIIVTV